MSQYDGKTIAEIVHDYAVTRGDLSEQYARDQLVEVIERRIARERAAVLREAADLGPRHFAATHTHRDARGWNVVEATWLRDRAEREAEA